MTAVLEVEHLSRAYVRDGEELRAIDDVTLSVHEGELLCVVGPSGCGKTTLLKCLSGLLAPTGGAARLAGRPVDGPPQGLALVLQEYNRSLLPWFSALRNVTIPLKAAGVPRRERSAVAQQALREVELGDALHRHPWQLSGGMQQRVAIARALATRPRLLVMDEPFAAVDAQTRADLEDLLLRVHAEHGITTVLVTHDIDEAVYLADRVLVLSPRPTRVVESVAIDLPRPRDQVITKQLAGYAELRGAVMRAAWSAH